MGQYGAYFVIDLGSYFNSDVISSDANRSDGDFNGVGETYPEEDLPASNSIVECYNVVFRFPDKGDGLNNNISLEGQHIAIPKYRYDRLYLLGAAEGNLEDMVTFKTADGGQQVAFLGLSGWHKRNHLQYGERVAITCSGYHCPAHHVFTDRLGVGYGIWMQQIHICPSGQLVAIELPENPGMHVFAMTLRRACDAIGKKET